MLPVYAEPGGFSEETLFFERYAPPSIPIDWNGPSGAEFVARLGLNDWRSVDLDSIVEFP